MRNHWSLFTLLAAATFWLAWSQDSAPADRVRGMINKALAKGQSSTQPGKTPEPKPKIASDAFVGVTLWELKPARKQDPPGARMLVHRREQTDEMTLVRHRRDQQLTAGAKLRFSVESARPGYLYVLTRELYADGTKGATYLIFPAIQIAGGENKVGPGRVVELPAWSDQPPYFTLERSRPDHVAEAITLLVMPEKIPSLIASRDPLKIPPEQTAEWEAKWGTRVEEIETEAADSTFRTEAESKAAQSGYLLRAGDPTPQTLFRTEAAGNLPLLVSFPLPLAK